MGSISRSSVVRVVSAVVKRVNYRISNNSRSSVVCVVSAVVKRSPK